MDPLFYVTRQNEYLKLIVNELATKEFQPMVEEKKLDCTL